MSGITSPYQAAFAARFRTVLQYRAAAWAGFVTQCWWGALKVMIYAAFFTLGSQTAPPMSLAQAITYTWLGQALLTLQPWNGDPEVAAAVRSGGVGFDRLKPIDTYTWWLARALAWLAARALPRAVLMFLFAACLLPLLGFGQWAWKVPENAVHGMLFFISLGLMLLLSATFVVLINICTAATLTDRGINTLATAFVILLSGNLIPLGMFPNWMQWALLVQPFAGMLDIPARIYLGTISDRIAIVALLLQLFWILACMATGKVWLRRVMGRLEVQGG